MAGYKVYTVSTSTWGDRQLVMPSAAPWARSKNGSAGGQSATFKVTDEATAAIITAGALEPVDRCLVIDYDGVVVYAGIIWETDYDRDAKRLAVSNEDIWSVLALRLISADRTQTIPTWKQSFGPYAYDTLVKRMVQWGTTGAGRTMPIRYEDDQAGTRTVDLTGYNLDTVLDGITDIMNLPGGPDIDLRPEWGPGETLQWTLRTGNLSLNTIEVDFMAEDSAVRGLKEKRSARARATQVLGVGEGSGVDMKVQPAGGAGSFSLERVEQSKNTKTVAGVQAFAAGELAARQGNIRQYGFDIDIRSPRVGNMWELRPGTLVHWNLNKDPVIRPDGWRTSPVLKYSGDTSSSWLHVEFQ